MSLRINGSVLGKRNVPTLSLATGMWNMRAQALYKRDNLWPIAYDPDAAAYFGAVATAGGTVSDAQKTAIDTFFRTGKSDGWYSSLKRMYLPIWAAAAPNAICMTSLTSGTFVGGVTHAAGYVQGNGTTGYFDVGTSFNTLGLSHTNSYIFRGVYTNSALVTSCGVGILAGLSAFLQTNAGTVSANTAFFRSGNTGGEVNLASISSNDYRGIYFGSAISSTNLAVGRRTSSGWSSNSNSVVTASVFNGNPYFLARNLNNSPSAFNDGAEFLWGLGNGGLTAAQGEALTANLQNLWETCTGLTLP